MGDYSEEHGERFHQDVRSFEEHCKGQYNESMIGDYTWNLFIESERLMIANLEKLFLFNYPKLYILCAVK